MILKPPPNFRTIPILLMLLLFPPSFFQVCDGL